MTIPHVYSNSSTRDRNSERVHRAVHVVEAVVLRVNMPDDEANLENASKKRKSRPDCDVLVVKGGPSGAGQVLSNVIITSHAPVGSSGQDYDEILPRGVSNTELAEEAIRERFVSNINADSLDGDFVLVGFRAADYDQPYIVRYLPHPSNQTDPARTVDGKPSRRRFSRKNKTELVIEDSGNTAYETVDSDSGSIDVNVRPGQTVTISFGGNPFLRLIDTGGSVEVEMGSGAAASAVVGEILATIYDNHTHTCAVGPTSPPMPVSVTVTFEEPPGSPQAGQSVSDENTGSGITPKIPKFKPTGLGGLLSTSDALSSKVKIPFN